MKISGIAAWAHISKPSKEKEIENKGRKAVIPSRYSIDLIIDKALAKKLKDKGYNVKTVKEDIKGIPGSKGKPSIQIKKSAKFNDGVDAPPPVCVDSQLNPFDGLVGNGSEVNVSFKEVPYELFGREGISARLLGVQVLSLVEYSGGDAGAAEFEVEEGFTAKKTATKEIVEDLSSDDEWA